MSTLALLCVGIPTVAHAQTAAAAQSWMPIGPSQIVTQSYGAVSGRVTSISVDPADSTGNTVWLGTAGGGVWRSVNAAGATPQFVPLTDDLLVFNNGEATASLAVGAVSVQPAGTGVVLAGTGEANAALDAHYGEGLLRSADGGQSWSLVQGSNDGTGGNHSFTGEGFAGFAWGSGASGASANTVVAAVALAGGAVQVGAVTLGASVRGLYGSSDAGQTWRLATIQDVVPNVGTQTVQGPETNYGSYDGNSGLAVEWNPVRQAFYAAVQGHGLYSSPDGLTWTRLTTQPGNALGLTSCPTDPGFAAASTCPFAQAAMAVNAATGDMFVWFVDANGNDGGMWQDICAAQNGVCADTVTFSTQIGTARLENGSGVITAGASGLSLAVVTAASSGVVTLLAGAESLASCDLTNGCAWQTGCASNAFPGVRTLGNVAGAQTVWLGTQGGVWRSTNASGCGEGNFANENAGLGPLAPLVSIASSGSVVLTGADALGSAGTASAPAWSATGGSASSWPQLEAGFGGDAQLDAAGGAAYLAGGAGVQIARCSGAPCAVREFTSVIGAAQVEDDQALPEAPFALDAADASEMLVGTCRVWRGPADGSGWSSANLLSPMFDGNQQAACNGNTLVRSVASGGPSGTNGAQVLYAGMQGLALNQFGVETPNAGHLFVTVNAQDANSSTAWTDISLSPVTNAGLNNGTFNAEQFDVAGLAIDAHDPTGGTVYATIYGLHVAHVYRSTDFGQHWLNVSSNLPDVPASSVAVDPSDANTVYIGMDTGVFFTQTIAQCASQDCWQVYGAGLPNTVVTGLAADAGAGLLRAATRGRGAWEVPLASSDLASQTSVTVSPTSLTFAGQAVGTASAAQSINVTVSGVNSLTATSVAVTGDFLATNGCTGSVAVGEMCSISVTFAPSATGLRTGTLTIFGNLPGGQAGPFALSGTGQTAAAIQISPSGTLAFGGVPVGQSSAVELVEVENTGQSTASLNSFTVTGSFAITSNTCGASLAGNTGCSVGLVFSPTASGAATGSFTVTDSAGTQTLELAGTGQAPANLQLSPSSLTFAATKIGSVSAPQTITVTNSGDLSGNITGLSASGNFAVSSGCGTSVAADSSCSLSVTFAPTQNGPLTGTLTLLTAFQTLTAQLSGTGIGTPVLTLTPNVLNFGAQNFQQSSPPQSLTVTNTGTAPDTVTGVTTSTATAGTADYAATTNCSTLAPGASCTVTVVFTPSVAGEDDGTLTVAGSVANTTVTAQLTGSGNSLAWAAGQAPSAAVPAGQTATYALQLQIVGYAGPVTLSCSGLPAGAECAWPGGTVVSGTGGSGMGSVMVTVSTGPDSAAAARPGPGSDWLAVCLPWLGLPWLRRRRGWLLLGSVLLAGCGSHSPNTPAGQVAPGSYTFTVTATGGGMASSLPVALTVE
jgi:hypothetical protein